MAGQGSASLVVRNIPFDSVTSVGDYGRAFSGAEGFIGPRVGRTFASHEGQLYQDYVFDFTTAADASRALHLHPTVTIQNRSYAVQANNGEFGDLQFSHSEPRITRPPPVISPPQKRAKPDVPPKKLQCQICFIELDANYSTPCRRCKSPRCLDCLKKEFEIALRNIDRMPVMCCFTIMHYQVARGVLREAEIEEYKMKFDEFNTIDPLYCPVPTCSTFIPPRTFKSGDVQVPCRVCNTVICTKCKQPAVGEHICAKDEPRQFILETFHYKTCPKCGTGVMKMFGCPHVRCQCGAHWCWDCQRPINACYQKPCRTARDDGQTSGREEVDSDSDEELDDSAQRLSAATETAEAVVVEERPAVENNTAPADIVTLPAPISNTEVAEQPVQPEAQSIIPSTEADDPRPPIEGNETTQSTTSEAPATETTEPEPGPTQPENLDDPDDFDWEGQSLDFGDEPVDEAWDSWGCRHVFRDFERQYIPERWLIGVNVVKDQDLEVECMACFKKVMVWETKTEEESKEKGNVAGPSTAPVMVSGTSRKENATKATCSFECRLCGIVYCGTCKKAATKRIRRERLAPDVE
ncbi:uncharacterized protein Z518_04260 [Rhinocladiella mackenziei CBS 650.93]|uniref:RBR-type E3 ubiquitin transferase n=1 Tax=Rhinocladiella mackenziei CBS 650.93 TaxID=1442369 RepID=A0A0D2JB00_9EURO|nr:uncharacterized protein Z518_04260 [Rhinocladiella mackenziei CBS 650.93]KIX06285.1 hypothetical protein Z518_04260 [Rhinocladiella mackenziei CBS 650.93]